MAESHNLTGPLRSFVFSQRSPGVSSQIDEDGLVRSRRQNSQKSARLLDLKRDRGRKPQVESLEQTQTHTSAPPPSSFVNQPLGGSGLAENFQYSESSRSSEPHESDATEVSVNQILPSNYQQPFFVAQNYHNPTTTTHRKTLHERLQGDSSQYSRFTDTSSYSNQSRTYESPPALMHEPATSSFSHRLAKDTQSRSTVHDMEASESQQSVLNFKTDDTEVKTRSRSTSVVGTTIDAKGMQGVVMEAMKSIQRYESENELQVNPINAA